MQYVKSIQQVVDYIESHILEDVTVEQCAEIAGFSKFHFHRIFAVLVGQPVMSYIRKRKMLHAMQEVAQGRRMIDIACDMGYGSERSFSRAFLQEFQLSPSHFRGSHFNVPSPINVTEFMMREEKHMSDIFSDVYYETLDNMRVASMVVLSENPEEEVIARLTAWAKQKNVRTYRNFGFDVPVSTEEQQRGIRGYEYWLELEQTAAIESEDGVAIKDIIGAKYAVLKITDPFLAPFERIPEGWTQLMRKISDDGTRPSPDQPRYCLEEIVEEAGITYMKVMTPVA